jgi:translation elongation factor EF-1beta
MNEQQAVDPYRAEAFGLLERNIAAVVEKERSSVTGEVGRLHNELPTGLKVPTLRLKALLNQAVSDAIAHQRFLQKPDDDDISAPPVTFEIKRTLVESYLAALEGQVEVALGLKKSALDLIQRDVEAHDQTLRRVSRYNLSLTSPSSFGYHWGRVGLGFENSLTFSNNAIKRAVTSAEESLMNSGKWVGTIAEYTLALSNSGEVFLPREIETVLFVSFDGDPRPVHDRFAEYMTGGTGIRTAENPGRSGFSDLGDSVDPVDGKTKRKYFVTVPQEDKETVIRYLAKRRFVPHLNDDEPMFLNNYEAIAQAAMSILTNGQQGSFEAAKQLLAAQVYQQYFKPQLYGVHNKPVLALR